MSTLAKRPTVGSGEVLSFERNAPRVLYLTKVYPYPPAVAGDAVYSRGIVGALAPLTRLTVLCGSNGSDERAAAEAQAEWLIVEPPYLRQSGSVFSSWPSIVWRGDTSSHARELRRLLRQPWDAIVLDNIGSAHALSAAKAYKARNAGTTLIYVSHEVEFEARRAKYGKYKINPLVRAASILDLMKVKSAEHRLLRETDIVTVINEGDVPAFQLVTPDKHYVLLSPGYDGSVLPYRTINASTPKKVAVLGGRTSQQKQQVLLDWLEVSYEPLSAAGIEILVVGDVAPGLHGIVQEQYPKVRLLGFVEDADPILADCRMGIVPDTVGGGFKLRLLTYVFRRVPIVGLDGAITGLPTPSGEGYLDAPDLKSLADLIVGTIDDLKTLNALQERCFADCADAFGWNARGELFAGLLRPAAEQVRLENLEVG